MTHNREPDPGSFMFLASGGKYGMRVTENSSQMTVTSEGRTEASGLRPVIFRQESDTVWSMCAPDGTDCGTAIIVSPDLALLYPPEPELPVMLLSREK
jgi:hypothetical protein